MERKKRSVVMRHYRQLASSKRVPLPSFFKRERSSASTRVLYGEQWHPTFLAVQSSLIPECSITVIRVEGEQHVLQYLAEVKHLPESTTRR
jgi:hypothetical protein